MAKKKKMSARKLASHTLKKANERRRRGMGGGITRKAHREELERVASGASRARRKSRK